MSEELSVSKFVRTCRFFPDYVKIGTIEPLDPIKCSKKNKIKLGGQIETLIYESLNVPFCKYNETIRDDFTFSLFRFITRLHSLFPGLTRQKKIYSASFTAKKKTGIIRGSYDLITKDYIIELKYSDYSITKRSHYSQQRILQCFCYAGISRKPVFLVNPKLGEIYRIDYYENSNLIIKNG